MGLSKKYIREGLEKIEKTKAAKTATKAATTVAHDLNWVKDLLSKSEGNGFYAGKRQQATDIVNKLAKGKEKKDLLAKIDSIGDYTKKPKKKMTKTTKFMSARQAQEEGLTEAALKAIKKHPGVSGAAAGAVGMHMIDDDD